MAPLPKALSVAEEVTSTVLLSESVLLYGVCLDGKLTVDHRRLSRNRPGPFIEPEAE